MGLTTNEAKVIEAYTKDEFVSDYGWEDPKSGAWVKNFHEDAGLSARSFPGVMSSLEKKGVISTNGESFGLTDLGREYAAAIIGTPRKEGETAEPPSQFPQHVQTVKDDGGQEHSVVIYGRNELWLGNRRFSTMKAVKADLAADHAERLAKYKRDRLFDLFHSFGIQATYDGAILGWDLRGPLCDDRDGTFVYLTERGGKFFVHTSSSGWTLEAAKKSADKLSTLLTLIQVLKGHDPDLVG